ncbi:MAG: signal peptide peptidase SppA [Planctomycetota bacterium]
MPTAARVLFILPIVVCTLLGIAGCRPLSFTVTLDDAGNPLDEQTVIDDPGQSDAKIALIDLTGLIADQERFSLIGSGGNPLDDFLIRLDKAATDSSVKAIVVRINSPGGTVTASDVLFDEIRRVSTETRKPIVAAMGEVAASGGYYVALAADHIVAQPTSITGSIGVIIPTLNFSDGLGRIGIDSRAIVSGPNKNIADPFEPRDPNHEAILQGLVDEFYERFRARVSERRAEADASRLSELTDGRIFSGQVAVDAGMADETGSVRTAFGVAKRLAGLPRARLIKYGPNASETPRSPFASLDAPAPTLGSRTQIDVAVVDIARTELTPGVAYYLWLPAAGE